MALSIDLTTVAIIFVAGLVAIGLTAWMLNRAWGDFPRRSGPYAGAPPPSLTSSPTPAPRDAVAGPADQLPAEAPEGGVVEITHPLVRRAVMSALERPGSPYAAYFLRDGDRVYLAAYRIADPAERDRMIRMFQSIDEGSAITVDFGEIVKVLQQLGRR